MGPAVGLFAMTASTYPLANIGAVARDGKHLILVSTDDRNPFKIQMLTDWTTLLSSAGKTSAPANVTDLASNMAEPL